MEENTTKKKINKHPSTIFWESTTGQVLIKNIEPMTQSQLKTMLETMDHNEYEMRERWDSG